MLHANMQLTDSIQAITAEITALTEEWNRLNETLEDANEAMFGKNAEERGAFDDNFSVTFRAECDRMNEIEVIVKHLRTKEQQWETEHYANL